MQKDKETPRRQDQGKTTKSQKDFERYQSVLSENKKKTKIKMLRIVRLRNQVTIRNHSIRYKTPKLEQRTKKRYAET
jgi:hypothetical protein